MALFYVTGNSAAGKSTICNELKSRGYEAYDADEGLAKWHHKETGYIHPKSSVKAENRTPEFLQTHSWNILRSDIQELAAKSQNKPVFLCGVAANENDVEDLFAGVFALIMDDDTLRRRLANREGNDWGKNPHELEKTVARQSEVYETHKAAGHIIIDAALPLESVVDTIIKKTEELEHSQS